MTVELNRYYYEDLYSFIREQVTPGASVLDVGCGDGTLLASLLPSFGVGVDADETSLQVARDRHPDLRFVRADAMDLAFDEDFDYVVVSNLVGYLPDVWAFLRNLRPLVGPSTRVILTYYNFTWEPILKLAQKLRLKRKDREQNWLSRLDLINLLEITGFEAISSGYRTPLPIGPSRVMKVINKVLSAIPLVQNLGLTCYLTARPLQIESGIRQHEPSCTVVIPTWNERGNISSALERMPQLGKSLEIIFVDGNSTDGTAQEVEHQIEQHSELDIKLIHQGDGIGKGDAVRKGFAAARGDVLMILDADLTVPPEDLPKFWHALLEEKGEFINGSRLTYPMEDQAMRLANMFGNKLFSLIFSWILQQRITDTLCGTKVLWARDYQRIADNRAYFGEFDPFGDFDLLFGASRLGLKICEVPIRYRARTYGDTSIDRWRHGVLLARMAWKGTLKLRLR